MTTCTRNNANLENAHNKTKLASGAGDILRWRDEKNYVLSIKNGIVFKQKFHTKDSFVELLYRFFDEVKVLSNTASYIYCAASKPKQLPLKVYEEYLNKEFNIEYPNGFRHNKHKGLVSALIERVGERYGGESEK